ncbi:MAG: hypothetical protein FWD16_04545 [Clostridia bacterium]|nr:hypothetical protein [Clostridia bacterium]
MKTRIANADARPDHRRLARAVLREYCQLSLECEKLKRKIARSGAREQQRKPITKIGQRLHLLQVENGAGCILKKQCEEYEELSHIVRRVRETFDEMAEYPEYLSILHNYYVDGKPARLIAHECALSERQFYRKLAQALELFGYHFILVS